MQHVTKLHHPWRCVATALLVASLLPLSAADRQVRAAAPQGSTPAETHTATVAATVDGKPIFVEDVARGLQTALQGRDGTNAERAKLEAEVLDQLIDQKLVEARLAQMGRRAKDADIDQAVAELETKLKPQNRSLADVLAKAGVSEAAMRRRLAWSSVWQKFLDSYLTDQRLEAYFRAHARDYDGSEIRVSHILLRPQASGGDQSPAALLRQAATLRGQIVSGKIDFAAAAKEHSSGPSRRRGGDLGFIPRHGLMVENFARAAFALKKKDDVSDPVVTQFGVHLIRLTDVKPGRKKWTDVRQNLRKDLQRQLFQQLAQTQRGTAKIEITGATPYFQPGTQQLVLPAP
jgi:parvulin-like peptidyl-prolyl isomerase